ncbi:MAG: hypothetical protein GXZ04_07675 [Clostridiales bacterium]|nr:hypothetical protein [Clostridiales bacterium]
MKLTYLGTAAAEGFPGIFCECAVCRQAAARGGKDLRTRSQAIIDMQLLIDLPPDTYWHMMRHALPLMELEHVLITHTHSDHFYPQELYYRRKGFCVTTKLMTLYGNDALVRKLDQYAAQTRSSLQEGLLACQELKVFEASQVGNYTVTALPALHDRSENCLIFIIEKDGKRLLYGNDTGVFPDSVWQYLKGMPFDLISLDCTTGKERDGNNHMGVPDLIDMKPRLMDNGNIQQDTRLVATHFSHNGGMLHEDLKAALGPHGYLIAYDGMTIAI